MSSRKKLRRRAIKEFEAAVQTLLDAEGWRVEGVQYTFSDEPMNFTVTMSYDPPSAHQGIL